MEKLLEAWNRKDWVHTVQITDKLAENGLTIGDLRKWLEENKNPTSKPPGTGEKAFEKTSDPAIQNMMLSLEERRKTRKKHFWCPQCGCALVVTPLPRSHEEYIKGNRIQRVCMGTCYKKPCGFVDFVEQTVEEIMAQ